MKKIITISREFGSGGRFIGEIYIPAGRICPQKQYFFLFLCWQG